ncbi:MAG: hypothetical protein K2X59_09685 [Sphingomonas sp.]|nr:hypothetical protein [Sphingomonas sp.]
MSMLETSFDGSSAGLMLPNVTDGFIKIYLAGELAAGGADRRLFMRINGRDSGYTGFVKMEGHAALGEWDGSGAYIGRSGWNLDASFSAEILVARHDKMKSIVTSGLSTFLMANNKIIGMQHHSSILSNSGISSLEFLFNGGVASGVVRVQHF